MTSKRRVVTFVVAVSALTVIVAVQAVAATGASFRWQPVLGFAALALFLEQTSTSLAEGARGSVVFVVHLAAILLFGPLAGAATAALSTVASELVARRAALKASFNLSQKTLAVLVGGQVYVLLGGSVPFRSVDRDGVAFLTLSLLYFSTNSLLVASVIALSSQRRVREVWSQNSRGALGYDLVASGLAILVAWCYTQFGALGLLYVVGPVLIVRAVYDMYRRLQDQSREMLRLMVKAIEARDPYTSGHSVRVATLSRAIAQELRLPYDLTERIHTAALLHDVGKIHEQFAPLLRKAERLTAAEESLMQTHPIRSADLVGVISGFRGVVLESVRSHHERWDGQGYPDRLSGDSIPLGARIITIADTVDAMTTDRPYRAAATGEMALEEIRRCRGTQFDPRVVDAAVASVVFRALVSAKHDPLAAPTSSELGAVEVPRKRSSGWRAVVG